MALKVFYSWQSDTPASINRNFIEDALKKAINKLGSDAELQEAIRDEVIEFDKDTQGVPGIPPIFQVILNKISVCSIFVPDLTFVGRTPDGRQISNPNVLIEYGWALKEVGHSRMIPIMNAAFGFPSSETLPFDMKHLRFPLTYFLPEKATTEERSKEKQKLVDQLSSAMALVLKGIELNREITDITDITAFKERESTTDPAVFTIPGQAVAEIPGTNGPNKSIFVPAGPKVFLRLMPVREIAPLQSTKAARDDINKGSLHAMGDTHFHGTYLRNRYGAIAATFEKEEVKAITQLFLSKEIWGFDASMLDKKRQMANAKVEFGFFPCVWFENCFIHTLANYLRFSKELTKLQMPLKFIAGATSVRGYQMTAPTGMHFGGFSQFDGQVLEENIVYQGSISSFDDQPVKILRPFFEYVWEECGLTRPDREFLG